MAVTEVLRQIAGDLSFPGPLTDTPSAVLMKMLDWMNEAPAQRRVNTVVRIMTDLPAIFASQPFTDGELAAVDRLHKEWGVLPNWLPPMQPRGWSVQALNLSFQFLGDVYSQFLVYLLGARTRATGAEGDLSGYELPAQESLSASIVGGRIQVGTTLEQGYGEFVGKVHGWMQNGELRNEATPLAEIYRQMFAFLRQHWYLETDIRGGQFGADRNNLAFALLGLLPTLEPGNPWAIAEALSFFNEQILVGY